MKFGRFDTTKRLPHDAVAGMVLALMLAWIPSLSGAEYLPVFGELTGDEGKAVLERYFEIFGGCRLDFDQVQQETMLDTEFSDSHGVTFWTTTSSVGTPLATPHNLAGTHGVIDIAQGAVGGSPFPADGFDSRPTYDIRFNEPRRWAGLDRIWSTWNSRCVTRFYARDGSLIAELNSFPERFAGYSCESENPDEWIGRIECTGELLDGIPQVGPSDNLLFGQGLDTRGPDILLKDANPLTLPLGERYAEPGYTAIDDYQGDVTAEVEVNGTVDHTVAGTYLLYYLVADQWGNESTEIIRTVQVVDIESPQITLKGESTVLLQFGEGYEEPGYTAMDGYEGDVTAEVEVGGTVDSTVPGTYLLHYRVTDQSGNEAPEVTRTVRVVDTQGPVITLTGENPLLLPAGESYEEPGFTAIDNYQGDVTADVEVSGTVDSTVPGTYPLRYRVADRWGNEAAEVIRTVQVLDTEGPSILLQGENPLILRVGERYEEPGFSAVDDHQGDVTAEVEVSGAVDHTVVGTYLLYYRVSDRWGNESTEVIRTVLVVDTEGPEITLKGQNPLLLEFGERYVEPGFTAMDDHQGDVRADVEVSGTVDSTVPGTYLLHYRVADRWGNEAAEVIRTVQVADTQGPVITLTGMNPLLLDLGESYVEPGYTAVDAYQGNMTAEVEVSGMVDSDVPGTYRLRYRVADRWGNEAEVIRMVQIIDDKPGPAETQTYPSGTIETTKRPRFSWEPIPMAKEYRLTIWKENGKAYYKTWQTRTSWKPTFDFKEGKYTWAVQPWDSSGLGERSERTAFKIVLVVPPATTLSTPQGTLTNSRPTFTWTEEQYAAYSKICIKRSGKIALQRWVKGITSFTPEYADRLQYGRYRWWVQGWGLDGFGAWSDPMEFTYGLLTPLAQDGQDPLDRRPTLEWNGLADAVWYHVYISRNGKNFASEWIKSETQWRPEEDLPPGDYRWWARAWNERGTGPWSAESRFAIGSVVPLQPVGALDEVPSMLTWNHSACPEATWFRVQIDQDGAAYDDFWVPVGDTWLDGVDRNLDWPEDLVLLSGAAYTWRIRTWQPSGPGPWSEPVTFSAP